MLRNKKGFYSELNLEDITDEHSVHAQNVFDEFKFKNLDEYHNVYVQSDTSKYIRYDDSLFLI